MKHTYKSMLLAAMALAAGAAGYFVTNPGDARLLDPITAKQRPATDREQTAGLSPATIDGIKDAIARQEYHISYDEVTQKLQSPNRKQNLRAYYKPGKLTVQNREDSAGHNFRLHLTNQGIFADGKKILAAQASAKSSNNENRLLIEHEGFTEEFINTEDGIRQNFIVKHAPENTRNLQVRLSAEGLKAKNGGENEIRFYRGNTNGEFEDCVVYSDLHCWDANKKPLEATLAYVNDRVEINVNVEGAAYPVTIDPILANGNPNTADKTVELDQSNAWLGYSVSSAGDMNGDGYSDVIVGAPMYDWNGVDAGVAYVFPGTAAGLSLNGQRLNRNQAYAQMGYSVASAGDVNKDGYSDVIVGSPYWEDGQNNEGAAFLYFGGKPDAQTAPIGINPGNFIILQPDQADAGFGTSVAMAGDVDADGYSDFLVGAPQYDKDQANEGVAFLYHGGNTGFEPGETEILERNQPGSMMGFSVAGAGDVNGDGASDVIVGARLYTDGQSLEGAAFVYYGSVNSAPVTSQAPATLQMNASDSRFGHSVSTAGDVNGDGFSDVIVGAYLYDNGQQDEGVAYIFHGTGNGISTAPSTTLEGNLFEAHYGESVSAAGDVNGDGYGDILIGAKWYENGQNNEGMVFVHYGSKTGLVTAPAATIESNQAEGWLGSAVASAGDVNGDGYSDIIIGCYTYDHGQNDEGQVYIYHGSASSVGPTPASVSSATASGALAGSSVSSAGDIDGNGLDDIVVGAPNYDGGQVNEGAIFISYGDAATGVNSAVKMESNIAQAKFGGSVSGGGDVNGDGYDDVIVGAAGAVNGANVGAAFLYPGGSGGTGNNW
ncbi:integrin alpha [Dyadobacter sp. 676]|uniref:Integrin alpha n=1 Tax=Dyadobacter sp. 676 TaxID=3088362 RepID=A0AAU8FDG0_9BACT